MLEDKTKVTEIELVTDEFGEYVPFCNNLIHRGAIQTPEICLLRHCEYYKKLYIIGKDIFNLSKFNYN